MGLLCLRVSAISYVFSNGHTASPDLILSTAAVMDSGDTSSDSSDSNMPRPGGGASDEEEGVYFPPHFPQRKKSGSDFSPHSESSEDDQSLSSTSEDDQLAPPINTYAPPPTYRPQLLDNSDQESGSSMEPRVTATSRHGMVPYQSVPVRNRPVNYKKFYSGVGSSGSGSSSESEVGWQRKRREVRPILKHPFFKHPFYHRVW